MSTHNVIVFGEKGSGKTSIINLLTSQRAIPGIRDGDEVLRQPADVEKYFHGEVAFYDIGDYSEYSADQNTQLTSSSKRSVKANKRMGNLVSYLAGNNGVSLAIMAINIKSHLLQAATKNHEQFVTKLCSGEVPVILVVTGCEQLTDMGQWWTQNSSQFHTMKFADVVCGCTKNSNEMDAFNFSLDRLALISIRRKRTKFDLEHKIMQHRLSSPWNQFSALECKSRTPKRTDSVVTGSAAFMITAVGFLPIAIFGGAFCAAVGYLKKRYRTE